MEPEQRQKLKDFADKSSTNKDVLLLVMQGVPVPAIAQNLGVGTGSVFARIKAANEIFGNNGGPSCTALKESLRAMQSQRTKR